MKLLDRTPSRLVLQHSSIGVGIMMGLLVLFGLFAGITTISMYDTLTWTDDFIQVGVGITLGTLLLGGLIIWKAVRVRRLVFDAEAGVVLYESRGLGPTLRTSWPLASLVRAEIGSARQSHWTLFVFADGETTSFGSMDPPTHGQIKRNVKLINGWLRATR